MAGERYRVSQRLSRLDVGFFTWHARLEANHSKHTWDELATTLAYCDRNEDDFVRNANEMLDGVAVFWRGLDEQRRTLDRRGSSMPRPVEVKPHAAHGEQASAGLATRVARFEVRYTQILDADGALARGAAERSQPIPAFSCGSIRA